MNVFLLAPVPFPVANQTWLVPYFGVLNHATQLQGDFCCSSGAELRLDAGPGTDAQDGGANSSYA